ncbi:MAG: hypothetical protein OXI43_15910 [Candidatus Poribacteria bacterium]|nr:hypothetical protein [Candidatus Poribacteria bacterium]
MNGSDSDKKVIGLYGEMRLAMELHKRGWQVYRAYIDEKFDFVILKSFCENCKTFKNALKRGKTVTQLCESCEQDSLKMLVRFIQVKTSEGIPATKRKSEEVKDYSFHPKIRYHLADSRIFYAWIQVWDEDKDEVNYFIFKPEEVKRFDNLDLPTYQKTDNQKTQLPINKAGKVLKEGRVRKDGIQYDYRAFDEFLNNFECLEELIDGDNWK